MLTVGVDIHRALFHVITKVMDVFMMRQNSATRVHYTAYDPRNDCRWRVPVAIAKQANELLLKVGASTNGLNLPESHVEPTKRGWKRVSHSTLCTQARVGVGALCRATHRNAPVRTSHILAREYTLSTRMSRHGIPLRSL